MNEELLEAARKGDLREIKALVEYDGANVKFKNGNGYTALHHASYFGHLDCVEYLVAKKANVNAKDGDNESVLHWAVHGGHLATVEYLVRNGAKIDAKDNDNETPLGAAIFNGKVDCAKLLVENGADIKERTVEGKTLLHKASHNNELESLKYLVQQGENVNDQDANGCTALHHAIYADTQNLPCIAFIIASGVDLDIQSRNGETVFDILRRKNKPEVIEFIESTIENRSLDCFIKSDSENQAILGF